MLTVGEGKLITVGGEREVAEVGLRDAERIPRLWVSLNLQRLAKLVDGLLKPAGFEQLFALGRRRRPRGSVANAPGAVLGSKIRSASALAAAGVRPT